MFYQSPSANTILERADCFLYEETVYLIYPDRTELYIDKLIKRKQPLKEKYYTRYIKNKKYTTVIILEWVGAPIEFLNKYHFSIIESDDYKEKIKELRKNNKKK